MGGSPSWQSLCRNWETLRKQLLPSQPMSIEEWRSTPLWRPHVNQQQITGQRKLSKDQHLLRLAGFQQMGNVDMDVGGNLIDWETAIERGALTRCRQVFQELKASLVAAPLFDPSQSARDFFVQEENPMGPKLIWQFLLPPTCLTAAWIPFMDRSCPV